MAVGGTFFSYVALGFGSACSLLYLVENRVWLVMFLRKLYRPFVTPSRVSVGFAFHVRLGTCLNDFSFEDS